MIDSLEEVDRARDAGVTRTLIRVTPGIDADTHEKIRTGHHRLEVRARRPDDALEALRRAPETEGLHVHIGSQLRDLGAARMAVDWLATFAARARDESGWELRTIDFGGGLGVASTSDEPELPISEFVRGLLDELERARGLHRLAQPQVILEPGRSLTARAAVTLYTIGSVKRSGTSTTYVAIDGGMSDNPRPAMYGARYTALLAEPRRRAGDGAVHGRRQALRVGRHADRARRPPRASPWRHPRRSDNGRLHARDELLVQRRPSACSRPGQDGEARVIRRRETIEDLLSLEL